MFSLEALIINKWINNKKFEYLESEMVRNGNPSIFIFLVIVRNDITKFRVFCSSTKWFGTELRAFFIFRGMICNGIPSLFRSAKQTREGVGESQFRRGDIRCGILYIFMYFVLDPICSPVLKGWFVVHTLDYFRTPHDCGVNPNTIWDCRQKDFCVFFISWGIYLPHFNILSFVAIKWNLGANPRIGCLFSVGKNV